MADVYNEQTTNHDTIRRYRELGIIPKVPTPRPCNGLRSSGANRTEIMEALKMWPTPNTVDAKGGTRAGEGQTQLCHVVGGSLNPTWVEWLMGFPLGWTALEASGIASSRKSQNSSAKRSCKLKD
jgi:hypothetical protein